MQVVCVREGQCNSIGWKEEEAIKDGTDGNGEKIGASLAPVPVDHVKGARTESQRWRATERYRDEGLISGGVSYHDRRGKACLLAEMELINARLVMDPSALCWRRWCPAPASALVEVLLYVRSIIRRARLLVLAQMV